MEKKISCLLFSILVLSACSVSNLPAPKSEVFMIDYSMLTQQGYFVTESNSVSFDYEAIGSIYAEEVGGWVPKDGKPKSTDPKENYYINSGRKHIYQKPNLQNTYVNIANKLKAVGANGIINLKVSNYSNKIIITGMAIKKKD